jgi:uncharacterized protein (DUF486 family)
MSVFFAQWPVPVQTIGLLLLSNVFMTFAWYGHLMGAVYFIFRT